MSQSIHRVRYELASNIPSTNVLVEINSAQIKEQIKLYSSVDQQSLLKVKINQQSTNSKE